MIKFSVWQSKTTGRTHILTFDSPEKKINKITPRVKSADIISTKRSLINANKIGGADKNKFDQNQIISERLDRLRAKYDKEASNKIVGEPGGCFIPLASKRRNSVVRPKKPSAAVLPMKMGFEVRQNHLEINLKFTLRTWRMVKSQMKRIWKTVNLVKSRWIYAVIKMMTRRH